MESLADKNWAKSYILDPLSEPQPSEESGPGTHFRPDCATTKPITPPYSAKELSKNPFKQSQPSDRAAAEIPATSKHHSYPSPPPSASPRRDRFPNGHRNGASSDHGSPKNGVRSRGNSLGGRFAANDSQRPLEQIKKDAKSANRSPHLRRSHQIPPDTVDSLSTVGGRPYHHEGPYDVALFARNQDEKSPLSALDHSTQETLKATPLEKILDSVRGHRPLDGVAAYAPGEADRYGHIYDYEKGENMMISGGNPEGGAYKRWPGVDYHPDDVKGKGEPSYSLEKALKGHNHDPKGHRKASSSGEIEMTTRPRYTRGGTGDAADNDDMWGDGEEPALRRRVGSLKKRLGSVRKHLHREA